MNRKPDVHELMALLEGVCGDTLDDDDWARLEQVLLEDAEARALYRRYINSHIGLKQYLAARPSAPTLPSRGGTPVLGWLGAGIGRAVHLCWEVTPFSLLVAIGLPLLCIVLLVTQVYRPEIVRVEPPVAPPAAANPVVANLVPAAVLTRMVSCRWADAASAPAEGQSLAAGRRMDLLAGLAEIKTPHGATVILQGPVALVLDSDRRLAVESGKLTAHVPVQARGFTVQTPGVAIVDLGTEFGVRVEDGRGGADVEVFQGEVQIESSGKNPDVSAVRRRVTAGRAVRIEATGVDGRILVRDVAPSAHSFVRQIPTTVEIPKRPPDESPPTPTVVADFSGGKGQSKADQFPGAAGSGWAGGWKIESPREIEATASVETLNPLHNGGDYLRVQAVRTSGAEEARGSLVRRFDLVNPIDLKKPHVVTFDVRIDMLQQFDKRRDAVTICNNSKPEHELDESPSAGWHISVSGAKVGRKPRWCWAFCNGNGTGRARIVNSRIAVREGSVYSFRVFVDPVAGQWIPSIAVDGGPFKEFPAFGMRSSGTAETRGYWPYLHFRWQMEDGNSGKDPKKIGLSVDSIRVSPADSLFNGGAGTAVQPTL